MNFLRKSIWLLTAFLIAVPLVVFGIVYWYQDNYDKLPVFGGNEINNKGIEIQHIIAGFELKNQAGNMFNYDAVAKNKTMVANFFFTSCGIVCPKMMDNLKQVQQAFLQDTNIAFISITVDPVRDSAARLKSYAQLHHINNFNWNLLTGDKKEIYKLARKNFYLTANDGDGGEDDFIHSEQLILIDKYKHIRGYYSGTDKREIQQLISDIKKLKHEN